MNIFEKYPKTTLSIFFALSFVLLLTLFEWGAKRFMGLGDPVVYQSHPIFGYRPLPNQHLHRFKGAALDFNNLGLRADQDWNDKPQGKLLFLGDSVTYGGSYISNEQLFSTLIGKKLPSYIVGNIGVNAWGIENVYALLVQEGFLPAEYYVSTFPEGDFLRGLNRFGGQPFWPRKPHSAFEELYQYYLYKLTSAKYNESVMPLTPAEEDKVILQAAQRLKEMDSFLAQKGYKHVIFITPSKQQALGLEPKNAAVLAALTAAGLTPIYLLDSIKNEPETTIQSWYTDNIHLSPGGHQQWAEWMGRIL